MSTAKKAQTGSDREIVITRLIDAPLERVWRAWADPKEMKPLQESVVLYLRVILSSGCLFET